MKEKKYNDVKHKAKIHYTADDEEHSCAAEAQKTPCIVVKGFHSVQHFLSWFQIDIAYPLILPASEGRSIRLLHDCIIICGFADLNDMLHWFGGEKFHRPPVPSQFPGEKP